MKGAPRVKVAELNPDCEGCQAASRRMTSLRDLVHTAQKKIREQATTISGYGWKRNCAETPVPKDRKFVAYYVIDGWTRGPVVADYNPPCKAVPHCCEGWRFNGDHFSKNTVEITQWLEIPEMEECS